MEDDSVRLRTRESLLNRVKGLGGEAAWTEFYDMYWRAIYGYALRFGADRNDAEDIVQEVFIKVFRKLPELVYDRAKGRFLSWIKTITRTTALDLHRRKMARVEGQPQVRAAEDTESLIERIPDPQTPGAPDPWEEDWEASLLLGAMERVRGRVHHVTYEAFRRCGLEGEPPAQVAKDLGITPNAVYVYKNRVVKQLQEEVAALRERASSHDENLLGCRPDDGRSP